MYITNNTNNVRDIIESFDIKNDYEKMKVMMYILEKVDNGQINNKNIANPNIGDNEDIEARCRSLYAQPQRRQQVRDKKARLCRDLSLFYQQIQQERQSRRQNRGRIKSRVFIKQLQSRQECLPGLFLRISKPHDAINGAEDWI